MVLPLWRDSFFIRATDAICHWYVVWPWLLPLLCGVWGGEGSRRRST